MSVGAITKDRLEVVVLNRALGAITKDRLEVVVPNRALSAITKDRLEVVATNRAPGDQCTYQGSPRWWCTKPRATLVPP